MSGAAAGATRPRLRSAEPDYASLSHAHLCRIILAQQEHYSECINTAARFAMIVQPDLAEAILALGAAYGLTTGYQVPDPPAVFESVTPSPTGARREPLTREDLIKVMTTLLRLNPGRAFGRDELTRHVFPRGIQDHIWAAAISDLRDKILPVGGGNQRKYQWSPTVIE